MKKYFLVTSLLMLSALTFAQKRPPFSSTTTTTKPQTIEAKKKIYKGCPDGSEIIAPLKLEMEKEILRLVNIERQKAGLKSLEWRDDLANAARFHAYDMATENYFDHDTHDRSGSTLSNTCETFVRIKAFVKDVFACAENISAGRSTAEDTVKGWMNSPGHKNNIMNASTKYLGVGYYYDETSTYKHYCVQNFGK